MVAHYKERSRHQHTHLGKPWAREYCQTTILIIFTCWLSFWRTHCHLCSLCRIQLQPSQPDAEAVGVPMYMMGLWPRGTWVTEQTDVPFTTWLDDLAVSSGFDFTTFFDQLVQLCRNLMQSVHQYRKFDFGQRNQPGLNQNYWCERSACARTVSVRG